MSLRKMFHLIPISWGCLIRHIRFRMTLLGEPCIVIHTQKNVFSCEACQEFCHSKSLMLDDITENILR